MAIRQIIEQTESEFRSSSSILRQQSAEVTEFGASLTQDVKDVVDTLESHKIAVGLAAPQIGVFKRICAVNISKGKCDVTTVFINPIIEEFSGVEEEGMESCMSLPYFKGITPRHDAVRVRYMDINNNPVQLNARGFLARVIQHEIDHLDGVLYTDRMRAGAELQRAEFFDEDKKQSR